MHGFGENGGKRRESPPKTGHKGKSARSGRLDGRRRGPSLNTDMANIRMEPRIRRGFFVIADIEGKLLCDMFRDMVTSELAKHNLTLESPELDPPPERRRRDDDDWDE